MTKIVGTYSMSDLLAQRYTPAVDFGFDAIAQAIQAETDFLNRSVAEMLANYAEESTDVRRIWGTSTAMQMKEVDELGVARTQKDLPGVEVDFPLRKFSISTGFTRDFFNHATPRDIALKAQAVQLAYLQAMRDELQFALFSSGNYSYKDWLGDGTTLAVKAFLNNDGSAIPNAPDGTTFAGTHSHYTGTVGASLAEADITTLFSNVEEHGAGGLGIGLFINESNVSTIDALGSLFVPLTMAVVAVPGRTSGTVSLDTTNEDPANKLVGYWNGYPVYTRSWVPANYYAAIALSSAEKPLVHRQDKFPGLVGLRLVADVDRHPLTAQTWEAEIGFGAWNRAAAAFLQGNQQTTYTDPTTLVR